MPLIAAHLRRLHAAGLRWKRPRFVFAEPEPHAAQKKGRSRVR